MSERPPGHVMRRCEGCGAEVWRKPSRFRSEATFCSRTCRYNVRRATVPCAGCGRALQRKVSSVATRNYCSQTCASQESTKVVRPCGHCGKAVVRYGKKAAEAKRVHCSRECRQLAKANRAPTAPNDANVRTTDTQAPPWPVVRLPEDDPRERIRARFQAVRAQYQEATA